MQVELPDDSDVLQRAVAAGFANVSDYLLMLLDRDADHAAIQEGIDAWKAGDVQPFEEFAREFRKQNGLQPRS